MAKLVFCKDCGAKKSPKGLYCKACGYKHMTRPSGLKYNLKVKNRAWFKKGEARGAKNSQWKGDKVCNKALHNWMRINYKWPKSCEFCGSVKNLDLANVKYKYDRNPSNWAILCHKCHMGYDHKHNWGYVVRNLI